MARGRAILAMPKKPTLVLALALLAIGVALRYHYFFLEQYALKLLIVIAIVVIACSVLMSVQKASSLTYKDTLAFGVVLAILCSFTYESTASNKRKNQKYFERLAGKVIRYTEKNHRPPESVEEALEAGEMLPNRGDADGNSYQYISLSDRIFVIRGVGAEGDAQVNSVNGNFVSFEELSNWVRGRGTPEEKERLELYWPHRNESQQE